MAHSQIQTDTNTPINIKKSILLITNRSHIRWRLVIDHAFKFYEKSVKMDPNFDMGQQNFNIYLYIDFVGSSLTILNFTSTDLKVIK